MCHGQIMYFPFIDQGPELKLLTFIAIAQFKVVPKDPEVQGVLGGTLDLEWVLSNIPSGQGIINAVLLFNETNPDNANAQNIISTWSIEKKQPDITGGKKLFPGRINASYKANIYKVTLTNLRYNDTGLFFLTVSIGTGIVNAKEFDDAVIIISKINGEYGFFIYLICSSIWQ